MACNHDSAFWFKCPTRIKDHHCIWCLKCEGEGRDGEAHSGLIPATVDFEKIQEISAAAYHYIVSSIKARDQLSRGIKTQKESPPHGLTHEERLRRLEARIHALETDKEGGA